MEEIVSAEKSERLRGVPKKEVIQEIIPFLLVTIVEVKYN